MAKKKKKKKKKNNQNVRITNTYEQYLEWEKYDDEIWKDAFSNEYEPVKLIEMED